MSALLWWTRAPRNSLVILKLVTTAEKFFAPAAKLSTATAERFAPAAKAFTQAAAEAETADTKSYRQATETVQEAAPTEAEGG